MVGIRAGFWLNLAIIVEFQVRVITTPLSYYYHNGYGYDSALTLINFNSRQPDLIR